MTQSLPPLLSYATPSDRPKSSFAKAVAIVGISLGSLELIGDVLEFYHSCVGFRLSYYRVVFLIFAVLAATLICSSIGCLQAKPLARVWIVRYAVAYLVACGVDLAFVPVIELTPGLLRFGAVLEPQRLRFLMMDLVNKLVLDAFTTTLPIIILAYLTRPKVRASFSGAPSLSSDPMKHGC